MLTATKNPIKSSFSGHLVRLRVNGKIKEQEKWHISMSENLHFYFTIYRCANKPRATGIHLFGYIHISPNCCFCDNFVKFSVTY